MNPLAYSTMIKVSSGQRVLIRYESIRLLYESHKITETHSVTFSSYRVPHSRGDTVRLAFSEVAPSPICSSLNANFAECEQSLSVSPV